MATCKRKLTVAQKEQLLKDSQLIASLKTKWQVPITQVKKAKRDFKTWIVFADSHIPYQNDPTIRVLLQLCQDLRPDGLCILGDFMDFNCISHWTKDKLKTRENQRLYEDYVKGNIILDEFDKRLPKGCKKVFLYGNHERFYDDLIEQLPELSGIGDPMSSLRLKERGYEVYSKQNEIFHLGKLSLCHGVYTGDTAVKKHVTTFMTNVLFAHVHSQAEFCQPSPAKEISIYGASLGCTCDMNPDYLRNQCHKWTHGFAVIYIYDREYFDVDLKRVINGKVIFNDKLYDGNIRK